MIALLITLGSIAAYLIVGWWIAVWDAPSLLARMREQNPGWRDSKVRAEARPIAYGILAAWPLCLPYLVMARRIDKVDPARLKEKIAQQEREIAELERKLL